MTLSNFQYQLGSFVFGAGTDTQFISEEGLRSLPPVRQGDQPAPRQNTAFAGLDFFNERVATITLAVYGGATVAPYETVIANISNAFQMITDPAQQQVLQFMYPGWANARQVTGRVTNAGFKVDSNYVFHSLNSLPVEFTCSDPLIYDTVLQTASAGLPSPTAGLMFPVTFNATFGASTGGSFVVSNTGNFITNPVFTITGPVTNPVLTFTSTGAFMALNITLGASDVLVVDIGAGTVTLNGTAQRQNTVITGSSWWGIPPGTWTVGVGSSDSAPVAAIFSAAWRNAWSWC